MNRIDHPVPNSDEFNKLVDEVEKLYALIAWTSILCIALCGIALVLFLAAL